MVISQNDNTLLTIRAGKISHGLMNYAEFYSPVLKTYYNEPRMERMRGEVRAIALIANQEL